jgi:hypothetical protein
MVLADSTGKARRVQHTSDDNDEDNGDAASNHPDETLHTVFSLVAISISLHGPTILLERGKS